MVVVEQLNAKRIVRGDGDGDGDGSIGVGM